MSVIIELHGFPNVRHNYQYTEMVSRITREFKDTPYFNEIRVTQVGDLTLGLDRNGGYDDHILCGESVQFFHVSMTGDFREKYHIGFLTRLASLGVDVYYHTFTLGYVPASSGAGVKAAEKAV